MYSFDPSIICLIVCAFDISSVISSSSTIVVVVVVVEVEVEVEVEVLDKTCIQNTQGDHKQK